MANPLLSPDLETREAARSLLLQKLLPLSELVFLSQPLLWVPHQCQPQGSARFLFLPTLLTHA